jgi:hypothetical protein
LDDIEKCNRTFQSDLFRPPYGKIKRSIAQNIDAKIIMWDVLSGDFDKQISPEKCLKNVLNSIEKGSIVVFHDSEKAYKNMIYALPRVLDFIYSNGWMSEAIKKGLFQ